MLECTEHNWNSALSQVQWNRIRDYLASPLYHYNLLESKSSVFTIIQKSNAAPQQEGFLLASSNDHELGCNFRYVRDSPIPIVSSAARAIYFRMGESWTAELLQSKFVMNFSLEEIQKGRWLALLRIYFSLSPTIPPWTLQRIVQKITCSALPPDLSKIFDRGLFHVMVSLLTVSMQRLSRSNWTMICIGSLFSYYLQMLSHSRLLPNKAFGSLDCSEYSYISDWYYESKRAVDR